MTGFLNSNKVAVFTGSGHELGNKAINHSTSGEFEALPRKLILS